jgi:predicted DCC family thiol-disulfide oxidoreductase YuxK
MDSATSEKPVLVYDGDCSFCRLWINRWRRLTGDRIIYEPFQKVAAEFPQIPRENFARAVQLVLPDGKHYSAAHAVFQTLAVVPGWSWALWLYLHVPGVAAVAEFFYRFVARNRNPLYRLTRLLWGRDKNGPAP